MKIVNKNKYLAIIIAVVIIISSINVFTGKAKAAKGKMPIIKYQAHVQGIGWTTPSTDGKIAGTTGLKKRMEALSISIDTKGVMNARGTQISGGIKYCAHVQSIGWMAWKTINSNAPLLNANNYVGTTGISKRIEAVQIELTGELAQEYDILYSVHVQGIGWTSWSKNGKIAGTTQMQKRLEAIRIKLVPKNNEISASLTYKVHAQSIGWMTEKKVRVGEVSDSTITGTVNKGKRLEAIRMSLSCTGVEGHIKYSTHVQTKGWTDYVSDWTVSGTEGQSKRIEAIKINLDGEISAYYDIYYRVHVQKHGWLDWAKNGQEAGTTNGSLRMEAIQVVLVKKGGKAPGSTQKPYIKEKPRTWKDYPGELYIKINKEENCVTVYKGKKAIKAFICSTGAATPLGTHYLGKKWRWQELMGKVYGQYCSQIDGDVLFHSVPYNSIDIYDLSVYMYNQLGTQASHGCVRLTTKDAKWIYDNCPSGTRVVVYESPDPGPLGKPSAETLSYDHTWDPTDPAIQ